MPEIPQELRSLFSDDELAQIAEHRIRVGGTTERDAVELAVAWTGNVRKIDADRSLPSSDRSVWSEHDLAGTLFLRDHLESALNRLPGALRERLIGYVGAADERYRSFTVSDSGQRIEKIAEVDATGRSWWWFRVPSSGPIAEDLARY
ncbi:hypothetical protein [Kitasatospora kifunensis]|uniref:Uncharacterized protein n=1 Tax=Kitasatospora kifunensis TaxID=58351 RepID=A0A7W7QZG4_KITKI|nr:hypothetical protein [Kitasatospora kifunensis]MBB4921956.1 hypothetical protein [Kitasatospora kifunensis]